MLRKLALDNPLSRYLCQKFEAYQCSLYLEPKEDEQLPMVIVVPSYNNAKWCQKNISSLLSQKYENFRIIYIDDASTDSTTDLIPKEQITLVQHRQNRGAMRNLYETIHTLKDEEIVVTVDGDDWLAHPYVLQILNRAYHEGALLTYGQYLEYPSYGLGITLPLPKRLKNINSVPWCASHLRTFKASLFKLIPKENFLYQGEFAKVGWDVAMMLPMIKKAFDKVRFIPNPLYIYNASNPLNDFKLYNREQQNLEEHFRRVNKT